MSDDVQPVANEGQGDATTDSGLYDLDSVAPEIRDVVAPHLKAIEGNVTKKFQEAADYRKQWSPYEETGINELDPEQVKGLLDFAAVAKDPEQFSNWWKAAGDEMGLFDKFKPTDDLSLDELDDDLSPEKIKELIAEQVAAQTSPLQQSLKEQEQERQAAQANEEVAKAMTSIRDDNAALFEGDEEHRQQVEQRIARLAYSYSDDSSLSPAEMIQKGFEDYKEMIGQGEKSLFEQKSNQPKPPEGPGQADTSPEKIASFDDPRYRAAAEAKLQNAR
jgi:hypothetical protein